jgi:hypothetical protein
VIPLLQNSALKYCPPNEHFVASSSSSSHRGGVVVVVVMVVEVVSTHVLHVIGHVDS